MVIMTGSRVLLRFPDSSVISISIFHVYPYIKHDAMSYCIEKLPIIRFTIEENKTQHITTEHNTMRYNRT